MVARVAFCAVLLQTQFPFPDVDFRRDVAETEKEAFFLGPAKHAFGGKVVDAEFSPDDQTLGFVTESKDGHSVYTWRRATGKATKILDLKEKANLSFQESAGALWIGPNWDRSYLGPIYRHDLRSGRTTIVFDGEGGQIYPGYTGDGALIVIDTPQEKKALAYYSGGQVLSITLPPGVNSVEPTWEWGVPAVYLQGDKTNFLPDPYTVNLQTGALGPVVTGQPKQIGMPRVDLQLTFGKGKVGTNTVSGHWIQEMGKNAVSIPSFYSQRPASFPAKNRDDTFRGLIAVDQNSARLAPKYTAVAYWDRHNLFVREVKSMPIDKFNELFAQYEKDTLTEQAKQVSTSMQIYSADSDDIFPTNDGTMDRLFPYAKDSSIFDNFQYSLGSQHRDSIKNPGETVLGRINGRNGRAIVYVDGRVIWDPKKKP